MGKRFSSYKFCASAHLAPFINCLPHPPFESESESESAHLGDFLPLAAVCPDCFSGAGGNLQSWIFGIFSVGVDRVGNDLVTGLVPLPQKPLSTSSEN